MLKRSIAAALALLLASVSAEAQHFGRNKVQYSRFDFQILETPHFDVYYYSEEREAAAVVGRLAERWYDRLSASLHHTFNRRQPVILYASHADFVQTSVLPGSIAEGVGGFTDHQAGRVVLPFGAGLADTDHVLGHEIVHAFQRDILQRQNESLSTMPLWFAEGMAEQLSVGTLDVNTRMWLRDSVAYDRLPTLAKLNDPKWFPYRFGQALWSFLFAEYGDTVAWRALTVPKGGSGLRRIEAVTGQTSDELTRRWHAYLRKVTGEVGKVDREHLVESGGGHYQLGPALSPDGRTLIYLSERDGSMDVFVADATTGKTTRKLFTTSTDAHLDSVQFIDSSGSWDATGRRFVMATVSSGVPLITVFDVASGAIQEQIPVSSLDQIFTPSWSPDGTQLAFTALKGGVSDIYTLNLADRQLRELTNDQFSDLQPTWSPDGRTIAFTSDRFSSSIADLTFGRYELALVSRASGEITYVGGIGGGKNVNPQWGCAGRCLYFVSDGDGVSNVYRLALESREVNRITNEPIGVSGIAPLSPAISVGAGGEQLMATVYADGAYRIRAIDIRQAVGTPVPQSTLAHATPATPAAPGASGFASRPYVPRLSLFQLGQPYLSAGGGAFGSFMRAGASMSFGDLLGQQQVQAAVQVGKRATDFSIEAWYVNRTTRWNWGIEGSQVPWVVGAGAVTRAAVDAAGAPILVREAILEQQRHRQLSALAIYPISRARRIETSVGVDLVDFTRQITATTFSGDGAKRLGQDTATVGSYASAASLITGAAFVHDTGVWGMTAPILGQRYRFGVNSSVGGLPVTTAVADYRRYVAPVRKVTLAFRAQELARFGSAADDPRVLPLVGWARDVVRGAERQNLFFHASRITSANAEIRTPLAFLTRTSERVLPVDVFVFSDWAHFTAPASSSESWTMGAGARVNAGGFVFEFNGVRPMTPTGHWRFEMNLRPGF